MVLCVMWEGGKEVGLIFLNGCITVVRMIGCSMFVHDAEIDSDPVERSALGGCSGVVISLTISECR